MNYYKKINIFLKWVIFIISIIYLSSFYIILLIRFSNPLNNGPFEDATLQQAFRINQNLPIYPLPEVEYIPLIYGPVLFYLSSLLIDISGYSIPTLRILQVIFNIGIILISPFLMRELLPKKNKLSIFFFSTIALGLFYTISKFTGYWLSFAKVDSIFVFGELLFLYLSIRLLRNRNFLNIFLLSLTSVFLFFTKQLGIILFLSFVLYSLFLKRFKDTIYFITIFAVFVILILVYFYFKPGEYFFLYNFILPSLHPLSLKSPIKEFTNFLPICILILTILIYYIFFSIKSKTKKSYIFNKLRKKSSLLIYLTIVAMFISYIGRSKAGAVENSWFYFYIYGSILLTYYLSLFQKLSFIYITTLCSFLFQLYIFSYNPTKEIDKYLHEKEEQKEYISNFCKLKQPILHPDISTYSQMFCGSKMSFSLITAIDIIYEPLLFKTFSKSFENAIANQEFQTIFMLKEYTLEFLNSTVTYLLITKSRSKKTDINNENMINALNLHILVHKYYEIIPDSERNEYETFLNTKSIKYDIYRPKKK